MDKGKVVSMYLDDETIEILKKVANEKGILNVSATMRYIVRDWYKKVQEGKKDGDGGQ